MELLSHKASYVPLVSGVERKNRRDARQERVFGFNPDAANAVIEGAGQESHEEYINFITSRPNKAAPRQSELSDEVSKRNLYGPAAIQAESPIAILAKQQPTPMLKGNAEVVNALQYIQGLLAMTKAEGKYFECALNPHEQAEFKKIIHEPASSATNRAAERLYKNLIRIINDSELESYEEQYEEFLETIFGCTMTSQDGDIIDEFEANFVTFRQIEAYCKRDVSTHNSVYYLKIP